MSTTSSGTPPVSGSRGRHGHTRSNHRASRHPAVSSVDLQKLRNDPQINLDASVQSNGHAQVNSYARQHSYTPSHIPSLDNSSETQETKRTTLQEIYTAIYITGSYVLAFTLLIPPPSTSEPQLESNSEFREELNSAQPSPLVPNRRDGGICLIKASVLTSLTLLLLGLWERIERANERARAASGTRGNSASHRKPPGVDSGLLRVSFVGAISIWLPLFASLTLGGERVALTMLVAFSSGLPALLDPRSQPLSLKGWSKPLNQWRTTLLFFVAMVVFDLVSVDSFLDNGNLLAGYLALFLSVFVSRPPFWGLAQPLIKGNMPGETPSMSSGTASAVNGVGLMPKGDGSGLVGPSDETSGTLISGVAFSLFTLLVTALFGEISIDIVGSVASVVAAYVCALSLVASSPQDLSSKKKIGLVSGSTLSVLYTSSALQRWSWAFVAELSLAALGYLAAYCDGNQLYRNAHNHHLRHTEESKKASWATLYLLRSTEQYPLLHSILREKDSRRIFYFMSLNFVFMLVQLSYGFATGSLGLLSDSIHMFFDCLALVVGLCAAVMSKWPPSARFPYGYGKVDTLAGFANGIFLMIISIEIVYEAVERLLAGSQMHRIGELLVVSSAGLCVNLVGIMAFDHAHHGHGHGHGHSHGHDHDSEHSHSHSHSHHANENMHGIFLHILADTLGSVAVVISTILVHFYGWPGFDPLASCIIAILIFASAIPLVSSTAKMLLLSLPADVEYSLRDTLAGVSSLRGVVGYTVPKFWLDDIAATTPDTHDHSGHSHHDHHDHHHHHSDHDHHNHDHSHSHDHHHDHHDHDDTPEKTSSCGQQKILGVIHVIASNGADLEDVRQRTVKFLQDKNMDVVVQVEREGDGRCWCGSGNRIS